MTMLPFRGRCWTCGHNHDKHPSLQDLLLDMRYAKRTDRNHATVRDGLRARGYVVQDMSDRGYGVPDLGIQSPKGIKYPGCFLEVKDGDKPPSARELTPDQKRWLSLVPDRTFTVLNLDQALKVCEEFFK